MPNKQTKRVKYSKALSRQFKSKFNDRTVLIFGKYKGFSILYVKSNDIIYYNWLKSKFKFDK